MSINMNGFNEFCVSVVNRLKEVYNDFYEVTLQDVLKNNDQHFKALCIRNNDIRISAVVYMEEYYKTYTDGHSFNSIINAIVKQLDQQQANKQVDTFIQRFKDFNKIRSQIIFKLVSLENNTEYLKDKPYMKYNNMAIIFCALGSIKENNIMSTVITHDIANSWDVNLCDLFSNAVVNTPRLLPAKFKSMTSVLEELGGNFGCEDAEEFGATEDDVSEVGDCMYILSNTKGMYGAAVILYPDMLKDIATELHADELVIIPSSIHEVIIIPVWPEKECICREELIAMIREVNRTQVRSDEVLSNVPYVYNVEADKVTLF